jgi:formate hydrogenlyase subunit 3/multisubunit Na+/H+ antiporter MnhD subunit
MLLTLLALVVVALLALGLAGVAARRIVPVVTAATLVACLLGAMLAVAAVVGGATGAMELPFGPAGLSISLALDGLSGFFLLLPFGAGAAAACFALDHQDRGTAGMLPIFLAGMALTVLAGDGFTLVLGFETMSAASWVLVLSRPDEFSRPPALLCVGMAGFAAVCVIAALALLGPVSAGLPKLDFAAMRAAPADGWRAGAGMLLMLVGAGSKAGLVPLHVWLPPAHSAAPAHVSALMSGAMTKVAIYVLIRVLFDLAGPATPLWWGVPLLAVGAASAVLGALRATIEADMKSVLACSTIENIGLITIALGTALIARAMDLPSLAALALGGALLHVLAHGLFKPLLFLCAGAAQHGAQTRLLQRLGGLVHRMPITTACVLVGAAAMAALPPGPGFASEWMMLQAVLGGARVGGLALQTGFAVLAALMALAAALAAAAAVRLVGVAFLGRPRTPRTSVADEVGGPARIAMLGLAGLALLLGLLPGPALWLTQPAVHLLTGGGFFDRAGVLLIAPQADASGYGAAMLALILCLIVLAPAAALHVWAVRGATRGPAWECGFAAPPLWLPFGDPLTQYGGASFSQIIRRTLATRLLGATESVVMPAPGDGAMATLDVQVEDPAERFLFAGLAAARAFLSDRADRMQFLTIRRTLVVLFVVLVVFLAGIAGLRGP